MKNSGPIIIDSIAEYNRVMGMPKPEHPLISVMELKGSKRIPELPDYKLIQNFYTIFLKRNINGRIGYGQKYYDFTDGVMGFSLPKQVFILNKDVDVSALSGWTLFIHKDFIRKYPLVNKIEEYGFFAYQQNEALHLSEKEEMLIDRIMRDIRTEYQQPIDAYSQDVIISHIELLLNYCNRFYNRQFITRNSVENELLTRFESLVREIFENDMERLPTVNDLAEQLDVSSSYLSDMLRTVTGMSAQQHIHNKLIEKAKEILLTTRLTINEIAYRLGFEYPQYFNRLFKSKTGQPPAAFRKDLLVN